MITRKYSLQIIIIIIIITFFSCSAVSLLNQQSFTTMNDIKEKLLNIKKKTEKKNIILNKSYNSEQFLKF